MKKVRLLMIFIVLTALLSACGMLFSGCGSYDGRKTHYTRDDAVAYIQECFPDKELVIAKSYTEIADPYTSSQKYRLWEVFATDRPDLVFHVMSAPKFVYDGLWGEFGNWYYELRHNYHSQALIYLYEKYPEKDKIGLDDDPSFWYAPPIVAKSQISVYFSEKEGIAEAVSTIRIFSAYLDESGLSVELTYTVACDVVPWIITNRDNRRLILTGDVDTITEDSVLKAYCRYKTAFRQIEAFSDEEILLYCRGVSVADADGNEYIYGDLEEITRYDTGCNVSFGTGYEILKRQGFDVSGNHRRFSYTYNGNTYEFSYEFTYLHSADNTRYYYLKNGERINTPSL
ncbi:MAG: hypothetical protein FWD58_11235, partial [Firmicutes bacterium]|nr:hypothetical protein [Bacillota bacterium]